MCHEQKLTLCFSGGGFRASIFHLGVVDYLTQIDRLKSVHSIYGVSGGSITAAHLAHHWPDYCDRNRYPSRAIELLELCHAGILDQVVWSSLLWQKNRSFELAKNLDTLFDAQIPSEAPPTYLVCSSISDTSQFAVELVSKQLFQLPPKHLEVLQRGKVRDDLKTSIAVAMSASFPLVFEPFILDRDFTAITMQVLGRDHTVADGGIVDNFGIMMADLIERNVEEGHLFLVSDAGRLFDDMDSRETERATMLSPMRTIDYLLNQNAASILAQVGSHIEARKSKLSTIRLEDARTVTQHLKIDPGLVLSAMDLRTNFDAFSFGEIVCTYRLGLLVAQNVLEPIFEDDRFKIEPNGLIANKRLKGRLLGIPWNELQIAAGSGSLGTLVEKILRKPGFAILFVAIVLFGAAAAVGLIARALLHF
jgi:predicted acylesterase/phospholipase RssA